MAEAANQNITPQTLREIESDPVLAAVFAHRKAVQAFNACTAEEYSPEWLQTEQRMLSAFANLGTVKPTTWQGLIALCDELADGVPRGSTFYEDLPNFLRNLGQARPAQ